MEETPRRGAGPHDGAEKTSQLRSFREISREFFKSEIHQHFIIELLLFGAIVAISAWPLFSLADAMANLSK